MSGKKAESVPFKTTPQQKKAIEMMVDCGLYATRGEAIRDGIRMLMERHHIKIEDCGLVTAEGSA
jgi:Arc/MetJ-type ribon-helix-helix transcriptional regulator